MWPVDEFTWRLERSRPVGEVQHVLVARMAALYCATDFFVVPPHAIGTAFAAPVRIGTPGHLKPYWCKSADELTARMQTIATTERS
jgi:hypothetical protein